MRGAPQVGFSAAMGKIRLRTSLLTCLRPPTRLTLETHVQYNRKPARCHPTIGADSFGAHEIVAGWTPEVHGIFTDELDRARRELATTFDAKSSCMAATAQSTD